MNEIQVDTGIIKLDAFLKWAGIASQGSEAKFYIKNEEVKLNGVVETQRGKKLVKGDIIEFNNESYKII
ncbi:MULTISPECIES: RNA-binding S4 domain-containing protein [Clostridium]|uniref:RNA-binding protein n=3 Tax=Clostridium TaxID=1485 RepID=A0A1J0GB97_9CLOT|nr:MULTISPECIES: RNA-binding S4 domain-containing protein [Clostridium]APC38618.1 RNA-binding protein [Clostridium estertheticum subsp. estertheticum]MBU3075656.1 RNA-binding S4 domain-containing protein [Clostridium estertheticum]MBU3101461.1 RNA-binding S4 domain-containing protein [Clostridium sp. DSM 17811]MBU3157465.1 RNA-binding S4 domain-containing protein [Clostridium estertheticum]MBU3164762.1 RNA-binding S4 domain-containing protein [Clostridium estertheticum]